MGSLEQHQSGSGVKQYFDYSPRVHLSENDENETDTES